MYKKIYKIRQILKNENLDCLFISDQANVSYLTDFKGISPNERECFALITINNLYLFTFPTYFELYNKEFSNFIVINITPSKKLHQILQEIIGKEEIRSFGFEKANITMSEYEKLGCLQKIKLVPAENLIENFRVVKEEQEITNIRKAANISDKAMKYGRGIIKAGISEKDLALKLEFFIKKQADDIAFLPIVAFNSHSSIPHYLPSDKTLLIDNSLILIDIGAKINNYCSDITRVFFYKSPSSEQLEVYETVKKAQELAINSVKPGISGALADKIAKDYIISKGYPEYMHGLGHGVGINIHEDPRLKSGRDDILSKNMVFSIEPGIYLTGKYGIRIEDLVVLREKGPIIISKAPKDNIILK